MMDRKGTYSELNISTHMSYSDYEVYAPHDDWRARSPPPRQMKTLHCYSEAMETTTRSMHPMMIGDVV